MLDVKIRKIDSVERHPNADALDLAVIGGFKSVVKRDEFKVGDLALYIPNDAMFTNLEIPEKLGISPYLTGKGKNRVKPVRLRGSLSEGIVIPLEKVHNALFLGTRIGYMCDVKEGEDLMEELQVEKYEEPIPIHMSGKVRPWPSFLCKYEVENVKRPESMKALKDNEEVVVTEKLHGTNCSIAWERESGDIFVCSRNMALQEDEKNLYWQVFRKTGIYEKFEKMISETKANTLSLHGEIVGVQDLKYGHVNEKGFYAFDVRVDGEFVDWNIFFGICTVYEIETVPLLYNGPYNYEMINGLARGNSVLDSSHIREGVVVQPVQERYDYDAGRVQFKFISEDYLLRKGNTTEYH